MIPREQLRPPVYALVEASSSASCWVACRKLIKLYEEDMIKVDWYGFDSVDEMEEEIEYLKEHYDGIIVYNEVGGFDWL